MNKVQVMKGVFEDISFTHVYGEFNHRVYTLSKEVLIVQEDVLIEQEFKDNFSHVEIQKVFVDGLHECIFLY